MAVYLGQNSVDLFGGQSSGGGTIHNQNKSVTPTESTQTVTYDSGYTGLGTVTVGAISSTYVGSGISRNDSDDLTVNGATITAAVGYYESSASKTVASGTTGTPTATKGTISNHSVSVTPSVTNTTGYITGGTKTGTAVSVSASELVSGTLSVTSSGTKDVTNYASASIPSGTEGTPIATKGTVSNHSVTVTPSVTNQVGFIEGSTKTGTAVSVSASELVSGNKAITSNGTGIDVTDYASVDVDVPSSDFVVTLLNDENVGTWIPDKTFSEINNAWNNNKNIAVMTSDSSVTADGYFDGDANVFYYELYNSLDNPIVYQQYNYTQNGIELIDEFEIIDKHFDSPSVSYTPTLSTQTDVVTFNPLSYTGIQQVNVTVNAMPSGSATTPNTAITANPTVSVSASGVITATTSASQDVTPTVESGYVASGTSGTITVSGSTTEQLSTQAGSTISPTESEQTAVPSNTYTTGNVKIGAISPTYVGSEITQRSSTDLTVSGATVAVPSGYYSSQASKSVSSMTLPTSASSSATSGYTSKATIGRSTSNQYINIPTGYNSAGAYYLISATPNGSVTAPSTISGTTATVSTGTNTITLTKSVSVTPNVTTAGYISAGTAGNSSVSLTANVTTKAAATITPGTSNQTIASGTYLTGTQTISGDSDLTAANIKTGVSIFNVNGTFTSDADATSTDILNGKTAYVNSSKVTGTLAFQTIYSGSSTPSSSMGVNGDVYIQV